jgi:hypothetical protein
MSKFRCACCGTKKNITKDHIIPQNILRIGGKRNAQPLCHKCNQSKGALFIDYKKKTFFIEPFMFFIPKVRLNKILKEGSHFHQKAFNPQWKQYVPIKRIDIRNVLIPSTETFLYDLYSSRQTHTP